MAQMTMKPNPFQFFPSRYRIILAAGLAVCGCALAAEQAPSRLQLELAQPFPGQDRMTKQLALSPDGRRVARMTYDTLELWQLQPPQAKPLLTITGQKPHHFTYSVAFDPTGRLHYLSSDGYIWLDPDLSRGVGIEKVHQISPDGRYALRSGSVGNKPGQLEPQYYIAQDDIYDLQQRRSVCQLPMMPGSRSDLPEKWFSGHWFAARLRATGPTAPKPLMVCNMGSGEVFAILLHDKLVGMDSSIDPQGHFIQLRVSGQSFWRGEWMEYKTYALPLQAAEFKVNKDYDDPGPPYGAPPDMGSPERDIPWSDNISPDGQWWVLLAPKAGGQLAFYRREGRSAHKAGAWLQPALEPKSIDKPRVVFSRNSRWAALQFDEKLYVVDLQADKLEMAEVQVQADAGEMRSFTLQAIGDNGADWLLVGQGAGRSMTGVWRLKR